MDACSDPIPSDDAADCYHMHDMRLEAAERSDHTGPREGEAANRTDRTKNSCLGGEARLA